MLAVNNTLSLTKNREIVQSRQDMQRMINLVRVRRYVHQTIIVMLSFHKKKTCRVHCRVYRSD